ncbi:hypothetical protein PWG68_09505, partial [Chromobacterium amazonense]
DLTGDPWNARTLEWATPSPPPFYNFAVVPKADHPAGERPLAQALVEGEAEHLREPVGEAGQVAEQRAADDGVVEVGDQEQAVVQQEVRARNTLQRGYVIELKEDKNFMLLCKRQQASLIIYLRNLD